MSYCWIYFLKNKDLKFYMFYKCMILQNNLIYFINVDTLSAHILIKYMFITNLSYNWLLKLKRILKNVWEKATCQWNLEFKYLLLANLEIKIKFTKKLFNVRINLKIWSLYTSIALDGFCCNSEISLLGFRNECLSFIVMDEAMWKFYLFHPMITWKKTWM